MKLHLPKGLRSAVMACMAVTAGFATTVGTGIITGGAITYVVAISSVNAEEITMNDPSYSENLVVNKGDTLICGGNGGFGLMLNQAGGEGRTITVNEGGTLEANGVTDQRYHVVLNGGVFSNTGAGISDGVVQYPIIDLTADSEVFVKEGSRFGLLNGSHDLTYLTLSGNTLTKTGAGVYHLSNTVVDSGAIKVEEGTLELIYRGSKGASIVGDVSVEVQKDAVLHYRIMDGSTHNLVKISGAGTLNATGGTINVNNDTELKALVMTAQGASATTLNLAAGKTMHITGTGLGVGWKNAAFMVNHWGAQGTLNIEGTLISEAGVTGWDGASAINVKNGGVLQFNSALERNTERGNTIALNLASGATLKVAGATEQSAQDSLVVNMYDGSKLESIGASATATAKFVNADGTAEIAVDGDNTLNLKGSLTGNGTYDKTGSGTLQLGSASNLKLSGGQVLVGESGLSVTGTLTFAGGSLVYETPDAPGALTVGGVDVTVDSVALTGVVNGTGFHKLGAGKLDLSGATVNLSQSLHMNYDGSIVMSSATNLADATTLVYGTGGANLLTLDVGAGITKLGLDLSAVSADAVSSGLDLGITYAGDVATLAGILGVNATNLTLNDTTQTYYLKWAASADVAAVWDKNWGFNGLNGAPTELPEASKTKGTAIEDTISLYDNTTYHVGSQVKVLLRDNGVESYKEAHNNRQDYPMSITGGKHAEDAGAQGESVVVKDGVWISAQGGMYGTIVGGNSTANWWGGTAFGFSGDVHILVDDAGDGAANDLKIKTVAGGSWGCAAWGNTFTGNTYVSVKSDSVGYGVIGGSYVIHGGGAEATMTGNTNVYIYAPLTNFTDDESKVIEPYRSERYVLGGSYSYNSATVNQKGNANVLVDLSGYEGAATAFSKTIVGGMAGTAYGTLTGKATTVINGANKAGSNITFGKIAGGVYLEGGSYTLADVELTLNGGAYTDIVSGGAYVHGGGSASVGAVVINLKGATISSLYAGGYQAGNGNASVASTTVNVYDSLSVTNTTTISGGFGYAEGKSGSTVASTRVLNFATETATYGTGDTKIDISAATVKDFDEIGVQTGTVAVLGNVSHFNLTSALRKTGAGTLELNNGTACNVLNMEVEAGTLKLTSTDPYTALTSITVKGGATLDVGLGASLGAGMGYASLNLEDGATLAVSNAGAGLGVIGVAQEGLTMLPFSLEGKFGIELDGDVRAGQNIKLITGLTAVTELSGIIFDNGIAAGKDYLSGVVVNGEAIDADKFQLKYADGALYLTTAPGMALVWGGESGNWSNDGADAEWYDPTWEDTPPVDPSLVGYTPAADTVTFDATGMGSAAIAEVTLTDSVEAGTMKVSGGNYQIGGSGSLKLGALEVTGGAATFVNGISVGSIEMSAGTLEMAGFAEEGAPTSIKLTGGTLAAHKGDWGLAGTYPALSTADGEGGSGAQNSSLLVGNIAVEGDNTVTLTNATLQGTITNDSGKVALSGLTTVDKEALATNGVTVDDITTYKDVDGSVSTEGNGYACNGFTYAMVTENDNLTIGEDVSWQISGGGSASVVVNDDDTITIVEDEYGHRYFVRSGEVDYDSSNAGFDSAEELVLKGGNLNLLTDLADDLGIVVEAAGAVDLGKAVELAKSSITGSNDTNTVTITGEGTYNLENSAELGAGISVGGADDWTGTVATGDVDSTGAALVISALSNDVSSVKLGNVTAKSLTSATAASITAAGDLALIDGGDVGGNLTTQKGLVLGDATTAATLDVVGELDAQGGITLGNAGSKVIADSYTGSTLDIVVTDEEVLQTINQAGDTIIITLNNAYEGEDPTLNGEKPAPVYGAKYYNGLAWMENSAVEGETTYDLHFTAQTNENWLKQNLAGAEPNVQAGATLLDDAFASSEPQKYDPTSDVAKVLDTMDALLAAGNTEAAGNLAASVAGSSTATLGMALAGDVERQLRAIRNRTTTMGVDQCVMHDDMPYVNAWVNAEGNLSELDQDGTYAGYSLDSWGGTVGFDVDVTPRLTLGMAVTAMYGDLTVDGPDMLDGDMDTYYLSAFARYSYRAWSHTFVGTVGMMDGSYERTVNHAGGSYKTEGDTEGMAFALMYEVGRVYAFHEDSSACWQPVFNVAYRHTAVDGYKEKGGVALNVDDQTLDTITFGAGARMQAIVGENLYNRTSVLELRALAKLDVGDRSSEADVAFIGGGRAATVESAELGAFGVELGAGLSIPMGDEDSGSLFFDVSAELRSGYSNVNGTVGYRINF